jgi:hypothetical protein
MAQRAYVYRPGTTGQEEGTTERGVTTDRAPLVRLRTYPEMSSSATIGTKLLTINCHRR